MSISTFTGNQILHYQKPDENFTLQKIIFLSIMDWSYLLSCTNIIWRYSYIDLCTYFGSKLLNESIVIFRMVGIKLHPINQSMNVYAGFF